MHLPRPHLDRHVIECVDDTEAHAHRFGRERVRRDRGTAANRDLAALHRSEPQPRDEAREAVRYREQHDEHEDPQGELDGLCAVEQTTERVGHDRSRSERGTDERPDDESDPADHRVEHDEDRLEHRERRVEDDTRSAERDQHPAHRRDPGSESERIELCSDHADAESGGRALVRAHRDETPPGPPAAKVGDAEREHDEAHERQDREALWMCGRVEVDAEEREGADLGAGDATGPPGVVEDEALDDEREPERRDGQVHAAGTKRGQADEQADRDRARDADDGRELERDVVVGDQARRDPGPRARERELRERELPRVPGDDHEREHDDRGRRGRRRGLDAVRREAEPDDRDAECRERRARSLGRMRPLPTSGGRSDASLRSGSACPRTMSTTMMTTNGTDRPQPCSAAGSDTFVCRNAISLSRTPISRPPASVSQYERNAPTSAAAIPGTTSSARFVTLSPLTFTTRIAATTARPPPRPQFAPATMSGEMPSMAGTRRFSATALVAIPKRVRLDRNVSEIVSTIATPKRIRRSTPRSTPGNTVTLVIGKMWETMRGVSPQS